MKKQRIQRTYAGRGVQDSRPARRIRRSASLPLCMLGGLESLESREMLAANILDSASSIFVGDTQEASLSIQMPGAASGAAGTFKIHVDAEDGSSLNPAAITVTDLAGIPVPGQVSFDGGSTRSSQAVASLPTGAYRVMIGADSGMGGYSVSVSLLGDVAGDPGRVSEFEQLRASAAVIQTLGSANFVTAQYFRRFGIDLGQSQADPGMDSDGNGIINGTDLQAIERNGEVGLVSASLQLDSQGPILSNLRLVNDTGVSSTDRITTDPSTLVSISDASQIVALTGSLNGGAAVDLIPLVGDFNATGSFLIEASDLRAINGGTDPSGPLELSFSAIDLLGNVSDPASINFTLITNNQAPTALGINDRATNEDVPFSFDVSTAFTDSNAGDVVTFSATSLPSWLSITSQGQLSGTPAQANVGANAVTVRATDSQGAATSTSFTITVVNVNDPPELTGPIPNQNAAENSPFLFDFGRFFVDPDGDDISFSVIQTSGFDANGNPINGRPLPTWLMANEEAGTLSGIPGEGDVGVVSVGIIAVDAASATLNTTFTITVGGVNDPPVVTMPIADRTVNENQALSIDLSMSFADPEGDTLTYSTNTLPGWLSLNSTSGLLTGTPRNGDEGTVTVTATATDPLGASVSDTFTITAVNINDPPMISNQSFTISADVANGAVVGTVVATDDDVDDVLTYSIQSGNANGIFAINASSGVITVIDASQILAGFNQALTVLVSDGQASDTGVVTITTEAAADFTVVYRLATLDSEGNPIDTVATGQTFQLVGFTQDVRPNPTGVFSAFLDVEYTTGLLNASGNVVHSSTYSAGTFGNNLTDGLIDDVGGTDGISPLGGNEFEVFRQTFTAVAPGTVEFTSNPADNTVLRPTLVFGGSAPLPDNLISFGTVNVTVTSAGTSSLSFGTGFGTNSFNPFDVNGDSYVSPLDALLIINTLSSGQAAPNSLPDVNADGSVSPLDALLVINQLVVEQAAVRDSVGGSGNILVGSSSDVSQSQLADALDTLFAELSDDIDGGMTSRELTGELSPGLVQSITLVLEADEEDRGDLWDDLADELAFLLTH